MQSEIKIILPFFSDYYYLTRFKGWNTTFFLFFFISFFIFHNIWWSKMYSLTEKSVTHLCEILAPQVINNCWNLWEKINKICKILIIYLYTNDRPKWPFQHCLFNCSTDTEGTKTFIMGGCKRAAGERVNWQVTYTGQGHIWQDTAILSILTCEVFSQRFPPFRQYFSNPLIF